MLILTVAEWTFLDRAPLGMSSRNGDSDARVDNGSSGDVETVGITGIHNAGRIERVGDA